MNPKNNIGDEFVRQKFLKLADGHAPLVHFLFHLNHMRFKSEIADWLLDRKLTGARLEEWIRVEHENSFLAAMKHVYAKVNRSNLRPILAGKDYLREPKPN